MARVTVLLPSLLRPIAREGRLDLTLEAKTVAEALERIGEARPELRIHLFDETGSLREHVLCFHNGENTRWPGRLDAGIADGDTLQFLQAVSGG